MPEIVSCPNCSRKLRVPDDLLGKTVKCPDCKEAFVARTDSVRRDDDQSSDAPAERSSEGRVSTGRRSEAEERLPTPPMRRFEDEDHPSHGADPDEDFDEARSGTAVRIGWGRVRLALSLVIWAIYVGFAALVIYVLCAALAAIMVLVSGASFFSVFTATSPSAANTAGTAAGTSLLVAIVVLLIGYGIVLLCGLAQLILQVSGHVLYLYIPSKPGTGRRPLAIATTTLYGVMVLLPLTGCGIYCAGIGAGAGTRNAGLMVGGALAYYCAIFIAFLCFIAYFFVHMIFFRTIARAMGNYNLGRTLMIYMIAVPVFIVLAFLSIIGVTCIGGVGAMSAASQSSSAGTAATIGTGWIIAVVAVELLIFLIGLGLQVWYVVILHQLRASITRRLAY